MPAIATTDQFLDLVRKSGLVSNKTLESYLSPQQAAGGLPRTAKQLAADMVRDGLLTHFQSEQLLAGKSRGFVLGGKYRLLEHLGAGGMGHVYLCEHNSMRRRVAIKVLPIARAADASYLERFYREARAVAALDHPNIVRAHDVDHEGKLHFLVMEYVDGSDLQEIVARHGPLDVVRAAHYISQAAEGLQHAHEAGLIHRDVKPANLLVDRGGTVKVLDLGLARFFHDDDNLSKKYDEFVLGTSDYLAPEQTLGSDVDVRADIYSLGATFYFLLTGQTLFGEGSASQKLIWHQTRRARAIRSLRPEVPAELADLVEQRMLAKQPEDRFGTPAEVCEALAPWTETPIEPPPEAEMPRLCPAARGSGGGETPSSPAPTRRVRPRALSSPRPAQQDTPSTAGAAVTAVPRKPATEAAGGITTAPDPSAPKVAAAPRTRRIRRPFVLPAVALLVLAGGGAGAWWAFSGRAARPGGGAPPSLPAVPPIIRAAEAAQPPAAPPAEGVTIRTDGGARRVKAAKYEAVVEADGCLTSLRVAGVELLWTGGPIARGGYFYQQGAGTLKMPAVEQPATRVVTARGDKCSVRYDFAADTLSCTLTNSTATPMPYYLVFSEAVQSVADEAGQRAKLPVVRPSCPSCTWLAGPVRLKIDGGSRLWGPWGEKHRQVWEATLAPGETRKVVLTPGTATAAPPLAAADLLVLSPLNHQVFQRYSRQRGQVLLRGRVRPECDQVEVRLTGTSLEGNLPGAWEPVGLKAEDRTFDATVPVAAGGWYRVEVRARHQGRTVAEGTVARVGVGEVFVIAGQSNATNCGEERLKPASGMVASFDGDRWQPGDDPQPGVHDHTARGSCWPAFGDALYEKYRVPVGIVSTGHSGSSVRQWQPDGELFRWMMARVRPMGSGGFRAVLWHQGESDVGMTAEEYGRLLTSTITASRKEAGWDFPWLVACVSYHNPAKPSSPSTRTAQKKLWQTGIALEGPDTDTLTGDNRDGGGKGIHFSGKGLRAHGRMWAEKVAALLDRSAE